MGYFQLFQAIFLFGKELFKYLNARELDNKECAVQLKGATNAIKSATKSKDTSGIESAFRDLGLMSGPDSD